jgi:hypothetical protein
MTPTAIDPLMLPIPEQKLYYANRRIATLQAAIAQTVPPAPLSGALSMRYEHPGLGWLTVHYTISEEEGATVLATYVYSVDICERLDEGELATISDACAKAYEQACSESNLDFEIERRYG